jgi:cytochrome P450
MPLLFDDPPVHTRARHIVSKLFARNSIAVLEQRIRALAHELVDTFINEGRVDLVSRFTYPLPLYVISTWMGLPPDMHAAFKKWAVDLGRLLTLHPMTVEEQKACVRGVLDMQHTIARLISERVDAPREDGLTVLAQRLREETSLDAEDMAAVVMLVVAAGHETTSSLVVLSVRMAMEQPSLWERLRTEPQFAPKVVEEVLRHQSPVLGTNRVAKVDVELGGARIPAGARVLMFWPAGNRDEQRFSEPDDFQLDRPNASQHLAFGKGIHVCPGAELARLEARVALEVLSQRLPGLRLVEEPQPVPGIVRHFQRLMLEWQPRP